MLRGRRGTARWWVRWHGRLGHEADGERSFRGPAASARLKTGVLMAVGAARGFSFGRSTCATFIC